LRRVGDTRGLYRNLSLTVGLSSIAALRNRCSWTPYRRLLDPEPYVVDRLIGLHARGDQIAGLPSVRGRVFGSQVDDPDFVDVEHVQHGAHGLFGLRSHPAILPSGCLVRRPAATLKT